MDTTPPKVHGTAREGYKQALEELALALGGTREDAWTENTAADPLHALTAYARGDLRRLKTIPELVGPVREDRERLDWLERMEGWQARQASVFRTMLWVQNGKGSRRATYRQCIDAARAQREAEDEG